MQISSIAAYRRRPAPAAMRANLSCKNVVGEIDACVLTGLR